MTINEILEKIPEMGKMLGSAVVGALSIWGAIRSNRSKTRQSKTALIKEYKEMYIKASMESLELAQNDSTRRRILIEMKNFCPDCYRTALQNLNIDEKDF